MVNSVSFYSNSQTTVSRTSIESQLASLGIPSNIIQKGPEAVKEYADKNGITLPEPPRPPEGSAGSFKSIMSQGQMQMNPAKNENEPPAELKEQLVALGIPEDVISQGRSAVVSYAQQHNISLPKPPEPPTGFNR